MSTASRWDYTISYSRNQDLDTMAQAMDDFARRGWELVSVTSSGSYQAGFAGPQLAEGYTFFWKRPRN